MRTCTRSLALATAALLAVAARSSAQQREGDGLAREVRPLVEFRPIVGAYLATGAQRATLNDAPLFGAQLAVEVHRIVHVVGSFSYIPSRTGRGGGNYDGVRVFQYDLGAELNSRLHRKGHWTPKPFVGAGIGRRTYQNVDRDVGQGYPTLYGAFGVEYQTDVIGIRLEARDYVSRFAGYDGTERRGVRNDMVYTAGIAYHIR